MIRSTMLDENSKETRPEIPRLMCDVDGYNVWLITTENKAKKTLSGVLVYTLNGDRERIGEFRTGMGSDSLIKFNGIVRLENE